MLALKEYDFIIDPFFEPYINKNKAFIVLCKNPDTIHFILRNNSSINPKLLKKWSSLSYNICPKAIQLLLIWYKLSTNCCPEDIQLKS